MEQKKKGRGRPSDPAAKAAVIECINNGLGYLKAVPILIEKGFVDENGECTINRGTFDYHRDHNKDDAVLYLALSREEKEWAKTHEKEIITYIRTRMQME